MISRQGSVFPFTLPPQTGSLGHLGNTGPIESGDARMITRQRLEAQLFATKETLTDLENLTSPRIARSATQRFLGLVPRRNKLTRGAPPIRATANVATSTNVEAELRAAREQINMLFARISALEGDSDDQTRGPPPEYV
jgi:hypothetical protein